MTGISHQQQDVDLEGKSLQKHPNSLTFTKQKHGKIEGLGKSTIRGHKKINFSPNEDSWSMQGPKHCAQDVWKINRWLEVEDVKVGEKAGRKRDKIPNILLSL